jgi:hypothetical protein
MENLYDKKYIWEGLTKKECSELDPEIVNLLRGLLETDPAKRWTPERSASCECLTNPLIVSRWREYQ